MQTRENFRDGVGGRYSRDNPIPSRDLEASQHLPIQAAGHTIKYHGFLHAATQAEKTSFTLCKHRPRNVWMTQDILNELEHAKKLAQLSPEEFQPYYTQLKRKARTTKKQWILAQIEATPLTSHPNIWKQMKRLERCFSERKQRLQVQGRIVPWTQTHKAMTQHLSTKQRGPTEVTTDELELLRNSPPVNMLDSKPRPIFTMEEFRTALNRLRKGRAPGPDSLRPELLLYMYTYGEQQLLDPINTCWINQLIPEEWKIASVVSFYKGKGGDQDAANYRPISLLNTCYKVYASMIQQCLADRYHGLLRVTQYDAEKNVTPSNPFSSSIDFKTTPQKRASQLLYWFRIGNRPLKRSTMTALSFPCND